MFLPSRTFFDSFLSSVFPNFSSDSDQSHQPPPFLPIHSDLAFCSHLLRSHEFPSIHSFYASFGSEMIRNFDHPIYLFINPVVHSPAPELSSSSSSAFLIPRVLHPIHPFLVLTTLPSSSLPLHSHTHQGAGGFPGGQADHPTGKGIGRP